MEKAFSKSQNRNSFLTLNENLFWIRVTALPGIEPSSGFFIPPFILKPETEFSFFSENWILLLNQCDQIWRNFATLAHHYKTWAILKGFIKYLAKL